MGSHTKDMLEAIANHVESTRTVADADFAALIKTATGATRLFNRSKESTDRRKHNAITAQFDAMVIALVSLRGNTNIQPMQQFMAMGPNVKLRQWVKMIAPNLKYNAKAKTVYTSKNMPIEIVTAKLDRLIELWESNHNFDSDEVTELFKVELSDFDKVCKGFINPKTQKDTALTKAIRGLPIAELETIMNGVLPGVVFDIKTKAQVEAEVKAKSKAEAESAESTD